MFNGKISALSSSADDITKRFLVEAQPDNNDTGFAPGTITDATLNISIKPSYPSDILLPLSAITVGQNGNSIFTDENGCAKEVSVTIIKILGETAEVKTDIPEDSLIVISGNQSLQDGDYLINQAS